MFVFIFSQLKKSILKSESLERLILSKRGDESERLLGFDFDIRALDSKTFK